MAYYASKIPWNPPWNTIDIRYLLIMAIKNSSTSTFFQSFSTFLSSIFQTPKLLTQNSPPFWDPTGRHRASFRPSAWGSRGSAESAPPRCSAAAPPRSPSSPAARQRLSGTAVGATPWRGGRGNPHWTWGNSDGNTMEMRVKWGKRPKDMRKKWNLKSVRRFLGDWYGMIWIDILESMCEMDSKWLLRAPYHWNVARDM